jgi:outer membrane protein insertion porin family
VVVKTSCVASISAPTPYTFIPTKVPFNLTNPDGSVVPRDPSNPTLGNVQIPLPIYRLAAIGGDTQFTSQLEYRFPIINQVTFAFFTDFGLTVNTEGSQLRQSELGVAQLNSPLYGCPQIVNGTCQGGQSVKFPIYLKDVPGSNFVPRMSNGAYLQVFLPIINAPFTIYYAYNPLRLFKDLPQQLAVPLTCSATVTVCFKNFFPTDAQGNLTGAGAYSYQQAIQYYGADYILREPRKTFRLTVSTSF